MDVTVRKDVISPKNDDDEALNEWDAQEAVERAKIAKEHGFKPWAGFAPAAPVKTPVLSKSEQENDKIRRQKELQAW